MTEASPTCSGFWMASTYEMPFQLFSPGRTNSQGNIIVKEYNIHYMCIEICRFVYHIYVYDIRYVYNKHLLQCCYLLDIEYNTIPTFYYTIHIQHRHFGYHPATNCRYAIGAG